ncbi:hypothetical protein GQ53DRAFT_516916 [Thozetella sp. PMI_491]|nr:hypothetical protein GQ53DRAFT_516916 [Thozetella sp. PMI_491]
MWKKASRRCLFGETCQVNFTAFTSHIESLIPKDRNVILVGHDINNDLKALRGLRFTFPAPLSGILDTLHGTSKIYKSWSGSLGGLLGLLGCPYNGLHCAGNDANFTLRAVLLLSIQSYINQHNSYDLYNERLAFYDSLH